MNIEAQQRAALIQAVVDEVLRRLEQKKDQSNVTKQRAVLLSVESLPEMESMLCSHFEVSYYDETLRDCDLLIIPKVCIELLSNLANGIAAGPRERFVLTMLLKGKQVIVLEEGLLYRKYKATAPVLLYKMYEGYANQLSGYGIRMAKTADLLSVCLTDGPTEAVEQREGCSLTRTHEAAAACATPHADTFAPAEETTSEVLTSKVITEAVVKKFRHAHNRNEIVVGKHSIITPLAQDYLRMQQMQVHRR